MGGLGSSHRGPGMLDHPLTSGSWSLPGAWVPPGPDVDLLFPPLPRPSAPPRWAPQQTGWDPGTYLHSEHSGRWPGGRPRASGEAGGGTSRSAWPAGQGGRPQGSCVLLIGSWGSPWRKENHRFEVSRAAGWPGVGRGPELLPDHCTWMPELPPCLSRAFSVPGIKSLGHIRGNRENRLGKYFRRYIGWSPG